MNTTIQNTAILPDIRIEEINSNNPINSTNEVYEVYEVYTQDNNDSTIPVEIVEESIPQYANNVIESNKSKSEVDTNGIGCITVLPSQDQHTINNQGKTKPIVIEVNGIDKKQDKEEIEVKDENGNVKYQGEWKDGKPEGYGTYYEDGEIKYEGEWKNGSYHVKGNIWFNYVTEKEEVVIPLKKSKSLSKKNRVVVVEDENKTKKKNWKCIAFVSIISVLVLLVVIFLSYYLYICLRTNVTIHNSFEWKHMNKNVRNLVIRENLLNDLTGSFKISNYQYLESLTVNDHSFQNVKSVTISDNPQLSTISFRGQSFNNAISIEISSNERWIILNRSS